MSRTQDPPGVVLPPGAIGYLRANRRVATELHAHIGDRQLPRAALDLSESEFAAVRTSGILKRDGQDVHIREDGRPDYRHSWRVSQAARPYVTRFARTDGPWPRCSHGGLTNLGDDQYGCGHPDCPEIYSRATAEEVDL